MVHVAGDASVGQRDHQEDAFRIVLQSEQDPQGDVLMMVADGMGGHVGGEIASNLALEAFESHFVSGSKSPKPRDRLHEATIRANDAVAERIALDPDLKSMGCTLLCALKLNNRLIWASVGDSPLFLFRDGKLEKINRDHSLYGDLLELVAAGKLTQAEADADPRKNTLMSAITGEPLARIDVNAIELEPGDTVVLASDGIDSLAPPRLAEVLAQTHSEDPASRAAAILKAVEQVGRPKQDNTTVIVYHQDGRGVGGSYEDSLWRLSGRNRAQQKPPFQWPLLLTGIGVGALAILLIAFVLNWEDDVPPPAPTEQAAPAEPEAPRAIGGQGDSIIAEPEDSPDDQPTPPSTDTPEASPDGVPDTPNTEGGTGDDTQQEGEAKAESPPAGPTIRPPATAEELGRVIPSPRPDRPLPDDPPAAGTPGATPEDTPGDSLGEQG